MCNKIPIKSVIHLNLSTCNGNYPNAFRRLNLTSNGISNLKQFSSSRNMCRFVQQKCPILSKSYSSAYHNQVITNNGLPFIGVRSCSSNKDKELPKLMDFPQVVWPSVFKTVRNWILSNFIIMRYFDNEFNLSDFVAGSKQAVELVSGMISKGDLDSLSGLVTPEVITVIKDGLNTSTLKQRQEFAIKSDDIYFCFPYEVGVMFPNEDRNDGENQNRFVEITMCYHVMRGLQELKESGVSLPVNMGAMPEYQDKLFICNYRFIREFTKGVQDDWTINAINHFKTNAQL